MTTLRRPTLSVTLLSLVTALLAVTVGAIAIAGRIFQNRSIDDLQARTINATALILGLVMDGRLAPASPLVGEMEGLAQNGHLPVDDEAALCSYLDREFKVALERFRAAQAARPDDEAAAVLTERSAELWLHPPPAWDGVYRAMTK